MPETAIFAVLVLALLAWLVYFRPRQKAAHDALVFDNRVLATIDGLYLSGMKFGCTDFEMQGHARRLLEKAHALPGNQTLLKHTCPNGYTYHSHTGLYGEHITFALLCIIDYADDKQLIAQCEKLLIDAHYM